METETEPWTPRPGGQVKKGASPELLTLSVSPEDYLRMQRLLQSKIKVQLELDIQSKTNSEDENGKNVIAEIPGTDPLLKDEIVMIGAHLDSWYSGTGATDNAAGCAVMMEVMRILKNNECSTTENDPHCTMEWRRTGTIGFIRIYTKTFRRSINNEAIARSIKGLGLITTSITEAVK